VATRVDGVDSFETWAAAGMPGLLVTVERDREAARAFWGPVPTRSYCIDGDGRLWAALTDAARTMQRYGRAAMIEDCNGVVVSVRPGGMLGAVNDGLGCGLNVQAGVVQALGLRGTGDGPVVAVETGDFVRAVLWGGGSGARYKTGSGRTIIRAILEHGDELQAGELRAIYRRAREIADERGAGRGLEPWEYQGIDGSALMGAYQDVTEQRRGATEGGHAGR